MSLLVFKRLNLGRLTSTSLSLKMADRSMTSPKDIIEDVLIKVDKFIFLVDFMVLDMEEDEKIPLILGRPFLTISQALIDVESGELTLRVGDDKVCLSIYKNKNLLEKENDVCMTVEVFPLQRVENMKKVPKETPVKRLSITSSGEEQWGRKLNSSINSKLNQNEMVPIVRRVDVMYLSVEGIEKSINVKKKKKKHKTSLILKNLISACFSNHEQELIIHSPGRVKQFFSFGEPSLRYNFVKLSTLNIALLGRQPKFYENPVFHFFVLFLFLFLFGSILLFRDSWFV